MLSSSAPVAPRGPCRPQHALNKPAVDNERLEAAPGVDQARGSEMTSRSLVLLGAAVAIGLALPPPPPTSTSPARLRPTTGTRTPPRGEGVAHGHHARARG